MDQLLTHTPSGHAGKSVLEQPTTPESAGSTKDRIHNTVRQSKRRRASRKKAQRRSGGWPTTQYLTHEEFREAKNNAYAICNAGYRWSIFISLRPRENLSDREKKRWIQLRLGRLGQALERRGQPYISQTMYEKSSDGSLHGHALVYVLKDNFDVIKRHADTFDRVTRKKIDGVISVEFHARVIGDTPDDLRKAILYPLKQHQWAGPGNDGSGSGRMFWQKGAAIAGRRVSYSIYANEILREYNERLSTPLGEPPIAVTGTVEPEQLALPLSAPPINIIQLVEQKRQQLGLPQSQVASELGGLKQSAYANALRGHDRLGAWRRNRALAWLAA
jgi:hypothetical protein